MFRRFVAAALPLVVLAVGGCSSSEPTEPALVNDENYVDFDDAAEQPTPTPGGGALAEDGNTSSSSTSASASSVTDAVGPLLPDGELSQVQAELDAFVSARDLIVVGEADIADLSDAISRDVRVKVEAERTLNLAFIEDAHRDARYSYASTPYILEATKEGALYRAQVCVDRRGARWNGTIDAIAAHQEFLFDAAGDNWILREINTDHDGRYGTPGLTCVPPPVQAAAIETTQLLLNQVEAVLADPALLAATDFTLFASRNAENSISTGLQTLPTDQRRITPTEFALTPIGIYPDGSSFHVSVSACKYYPDGAINEVIGTDERVPALTSIGEGTSVEDRYIVFVDVSAEDGSVTTSVVDLETSVALGCWTG